MISEFFHTLRHQNCVGSGLGSGGLFLQVFVPPTQIAQKQRQGLEYRLLKSGSCPVLLSRRFARHIAAIRLLETGYLLLAPSWWGSGCQID